MSATPNIPTAGDGGGIPIAIDRLHESPTNPRKRYSEVEMAELAADVKELGVHSPLLVRPRVPALFARHQALEPDPNAIAGYEIVFGHRRYRAAKMAGLLEVPCMVRDLDDKQAARMQISENLQREDVHPIEEAESFQALMDEHGMSADEIAKQINQSRSYVYSRMKLLSLCPEVRKAVLADEIGSEVGVLIARLRTDKLQAKALGYIRGKYLDMTDGGKRSFRAIRDLLNEKFTLDLNKAMFNIEDETLLSSAGNCVTCPKRSANAPEFADVLEGEKLPHYSQRNHGADVCTDPDCFEAKKKAHLKREAGKLEAAGKVVVSGNAARSAIDANGKVKGAYIALADVKAQIKALPKKGSAAAQDAPAPTIVTIQDPRTAKTVQAVKRSDLEAAGIKKAEPKDTKPAGPDRFERERMAREKKAEIETKVRRALLTRVREKIVKADRSLFDLRLLARNALGMMDYDGKDLLQELRGGIKWQVLEDSIDSLSADALSLLLLDIALGFEVEVDGWDLQQGRAPAAALMAAAAHYGVDVGQVRADIVGPTSTPSSAARAPKKAAAGAGAKKATKAKRGALKPFDDGAPREPELALDDQDDDAGDAGERCDATEGAEA